MNNKAKYLIIYFILIFILYISTIHTYIQFYDIDRIGIKEFKEFYLSNQKMFFNNTYIFTIYLYINRTEYLSPIIAVRFNKIYNTNFIYNIILNSMFVTLFLFVTCFLTSFILNLTVDVKTLLYFIYLFLFFIKINSFYFLSYVLTSNHVVSLFLVILESTIILITYLCLGFIGIDLSDIIKIFVSPIYCLVVSIVITILSIRIANRKDCI